MRLGRDIMIRRRERERYREIDIKERYSIERGRDRERH